MLDSPDNKPHLFPFDGHWPLINKNAFIASGVKVIGKVEICEDVGVWFNSVIRGDVGSIYIDQGTNIQDGTIIHVSRSSQGDTKIGKNVTIGHNAIIHACKLNDDSFIGMGAIIMDGAEVGKCAMVAAGSLVPPNKMIKNGELWAGIPSRFVRNLTTEEIKTNKETAQHYIGLRQKYANINI